MNTCPTHNIPLVSVMEIDSETRQLKPTGEYICLECESVHDAPPASGYAYEAQMREDLQAMRSFPWLQQK